MTNPRTKFEEWAKLADEDEQMAEIALRENGPTNQVCFHSQQLAEKYLKGFLAFSGQKFKKVHQLVYLLDLCEDIDPSFQELRESVVYLTQFYIETRYPGDMQEFNLSEAQEAFKMAVGVKGFTLERIEK